MARAASRLRTHGERLRVRDRPAYPGSSRHGPQHAGGRVEGAHGCPSAGKAGPDVPPVATADSYVSTRWVKVLVAAQPSTSVRAVKADRLAMGFM